jgi:hypothetical protein
MKVSIITNTNGKGPNTTDSKSILISELGFGFKSTDLYPELPFNGELRAYFDPCGFTDNSWSVLADGYICGDRQWIREFKNALKAHGFSIKAVQSIKYSSLDRQGENYVSLDIGQTFFSSWNRLKRLNKA